MLAELHLFVPGPGWYSSSVSAARRPSSFKGYENMSLGAGDGGRFFVCEKLGTGRRGS